MLRTFLRKSQNLLNASKLKHYSIYALGEILLVVIGILIAVQINNLNEKRKDIQKQKINAGLLVENLVKDNIYIVKWKEWTNTDRQTLTDQNNRINSLDANIDALIQIATREFQPGVNRVDFTNDATFNSMLNTGEINLCEKSLTEEIYELYAMEKTAEERSEYSFEHYLRTINQYLSKYTFGHGRADPISPIYNIIWENLNPVDFTATFINMFHTKNLFYNQVEWSMQNTEEGINNLLPKLRKVSKHGS